MTPSESLQRLVEGNQRYVANVRGAESTPSHFRRVELATAQRPFAVVLGCSDSRVPAELVFDQGLGDLFVIRVAGNIVAPSQLASVEFAAQAFGCSLVVVLGHSQCSAVSATLDDMTPGAADAPASLNSIISRIRPVVVPLVELGNALPRETLMRAAVRANIRASVDAIQRGTPLLEGLSVSEQLVVVGAEYDLVTGVVDVMQPLRSRASTNPPPTT
ncbi:MAG: carbonic anhydrase [Myxococcales bacterium]|nr:carbonic anhydrase [Myxococcales bacterium]